MLIKRERKTIGRKQQKDGRDEDDGGKEGVETGRQ